MRKCFICNKEVEHEDIIKMETGVVKDKQGNVIKIETPPPEYVCTL